MGIYWKMKYLQITHAILFLEEIFEIFDSLWEIATYTYT